MLRLHVQEIRAPLSDASRNPAIALFDAPTHHNFWLDSMIELEEGLDIVEVSEDEHVTDTQNPPTAPPRGR